MKNKLSTLLFDHLEASKERNAPYLDLTKARCIYVTLCISENLKSDSDEAIAVLEAAYRHLHIPEMIFADFFDFMNFYLKENKYGLDIISCNVL